jgi:hypothetical protein
MQRDMKLDGRQIQSGRRREEISCLCRESNLDFSVIQPWPSHNTDYATLAILVHFCFSYFKSPEVFSNYYAKSAFINRDLIPMYNWNCCSSVIVEIKTEITDMCKGRSYFHRKSPRITAWGWISKLLPVRRSREIQIKPAVLRAGFIFVTINFIFSITNITRYAKHGNINSLKQ